MKFQMVLLMEMFTSGIKRAKFKNFSFYEGVSKLVIALIWKTRLCTDQGLLHIYCYNTQRETFTVYERLF